MNWHQRPRSECEAAAAAGDEGAKAVMRLHESLDRLEAQVAETRESLTRLRDTAREGLDQLRQDLIQREREKHENER